jgi:hypothetical protein
MRSPMSSLFNLSESIGKNYSTVAVTILKLGSLTVLVGMMQASLQPDSDLDPLECRDTFEDCYFVWEAILLFCATGKGETFLA